MLELILLLASEHQEVRDDVIQPLRFTIDDANQHLLLVVERGNLRKHPHRSCNRRKWITDLVSNARCHATYSRESVAQTNFSFEAANLGEIVEGINVSGGPGIRSRENSCSHAKGFL